MDAKKKAELAVVQDLLGRLQRSAPEYCTIGNIESSERPDFIVTINQQQFGMEVTESVFQEFRRGEILHRRELPSCFVTLTNLTDGERRRSNDEIKRDMLAVPDGRWQPADEYLEQWRTKIENSYQRKLLKLNQVGFRVCDQNWCLIYDDPPLDPYEVIYAEAETLMQSIVAPPSNLARSFDALFVLSGDLWFWWSQRILRVFFQDSLRKEIRA